MCVTKQRSAGGKGEDSDQEASAPNRMATLLPSEMLHGPCKEADGPGFARGALEDKLNTGSETPLPCDLKILPSIQAGRWAESCSAGIQEEPRMVRKKEPMWDSIYSHKSQHSAQGGMH